MKIKLSILALVLLAGSAQAGMTSIAQLPLLNITGTGAVKPNLMLLYDNSGSMSSTYTPDYVDDTTTCRSRSLMAGNNTRGCKVGDPPFNSPDFNKQYYNPKVLYSPPVRADGTSYDSLDRSHTSSWSSVTTDGFEINDNNMLGTRVSSTNLVTGFPDLKWCDSGGQCGFNTATYTYPSDTKYNATTFNANPYYYTINVAEYCTDSSLTNCVGTAVSDPAPAGYPIPAKVRWCDTTALTNCQSKYVGSFKYPRFSNPNSGQVAAYGTISVDASATATSLDITSVTVGEPGGTVVITNGVVNAPNGTNSTTKQATLATALAASIIAKSGLSNQYTACVRTPTPSGTVPTCSSFGIPVGANNIVAVIPITCVAGTSGKAMGPCSVVSDASRSGWPIVVNAPVSPLQPAQLSTALITFSGQTSKNSNSVLSSLSLGSTVVFSSALDFGKNRSASEVADSLIAKIGSTGAVKAYLAPNSVSTACANASAGSVCVVDTSTSATAGAGITLGSWSNLNKLSWNITSSTGYQGPASDRIPTTSTVLGAGSAVFARTDIVSTRTSYPRDVSRTDCVTSSASCSYDEEMTNFANWYGYYKTRNQMMKTAVGQAFRPITAAYQVGLVSLSVAASQGTMNVPKPFSGSARSTWYASLYAMDGSNSTPLRPALHAIGKMYANLDPYVAAAGAEVVQYPCQQNFTFVTTDGYWNGSVAPDVVNNDNVESANRFCLRSKGCVDPAAQTGNTLSDVALYWYNGGSNTTSTSLRPSLENWSKPGLVPAAAGENTRLHMNTYALGLGVDGIMTYEPNYDRAAVAGGDFYKLITGVSTGCPWNNNGPYVWPDARTSDTSTAAYQSRVDDLWHTAINGHGKYFSASDPKQVVEGLRSALNNIEIKIGAAAAAATSTPNISQQDNDIFSDTFTTVKWYGELSDKKIDTVTGIVQSTVVWNTSDLLGRKVGAASDTRRIVMQDGSGGLKDFKYGSLSDLEKGWFDNKCNALAQCANLSAADRAIINSGANIVDWLRGQQQYANDTVLRAYSQTSNKPAGLETTIPIVLGDIASSKPAFLRDARKAYTIEGYSAFRAATADRRPTVFAAANDGMLHAFNVKDQTPYVAGEEMWAYAPRLTMSKLHLQASTTYGTNHQFTTDGSPELGDVKIGTQWKTVLVAGLNAGGRGYYALDVTDPANPLPLWEICADAAVCPGNKHYPDLGLSFGNAQFGTWKDGTGEHWVVFLASGYNNVPGDPAHPELTGKGILFVVDVASGALLAKISTGSGDATTPSGLAKITAITANPLTDPLVTSVYGGDNLGQMWRFSFPSAGVQTVTKMGDAGALQPITTRPDVTICKVGSGPTAEGKIVVAFGTGRLLDVSDVSNTDRQSVYVLKDMPTGISAADWRNTATMARQTLTRVAGTNTDSYTISGTPVNFATHAGWWVDLDQNPGERVNLDPKIVSGGLNAVTNLPSSSSACAVGGTSNVYQLDVCTGKAIGSSSASDGSGTDTGSGSGTGGAHNGADRIAGGTLSNTSAAVGFIIIRLPSGALKMITTTADGNTITSGVAPAVTLGTRKAGWRRIRN